ncbi:putative oxidoreductase, partial [Lachnellula suecica]
MGGILSQLFPPSPTFTEKEVPSLLGKVFIVTGGNAGVGLELVKILYSKDATVYIAARSPNRIAAEIEAVKATYPTSQGNLKSLHLDLNDLATVSKCVSTFLTQESRLDVLWNNAGISRAPIGSTSVQGHEAHMAVNCLGPFLLTKLLLPILRTTAASIPEASVRVVFASSGIIDMKGPPGGVSLAELAPGIHSTDIAYNYAASKAGNWLLASEFHKRTREDGIVAPWVMMAMMRPFMYEPKMGAYTELWAGLSPN